MKRLLYLDRNKIKLVSTILGHVLNKKRLHMSWKFWLGLQAAAYPGKSCFRTIPMHCNECDRACIQGDSLPLLTTIPSQHKLHSRVLHWHNTSTFEKQKLAHCNKLI